MYSSMFNSLTNVSNKHKQEKCNSTEQETIDFVLRLLNDEVSLNSSVKNEVAAGSDVSSAINTCFKELSVDNVLDNSRNDVESKTNYFRENRQIYVSDHKKKTILSTQIQSLQCLFTWKSSKSKFTNKQNIIAYIKNKYGDYNLDISILEFTFVRFIGNLIISYELYQNGESDASNMKIMEISNWLEKLNNGTDTFYLSINNALNHIKMANFVHMLFNSNETGGLKLLLNEIVPFDRMDKRSQAAIHAIHAIILIEYGESFNSFVNACKYTYKACELDPKISQWFHINSLVLAAQRHFAHNLKKNDIGSFCSYKKLCSTENEINLAIRRAVLSSYGKHTSSIHSLVLSTLNHFTPPNIQPLAVIKPINYKYTLGKEVNSNFEKDMKIIVQKHEKGINVIPCLTHLIPKYRKYHKWKIITEICLYSILFQNNLKYGAELFLALIEDFNISANDLICHNSAFINNSKPFNLAELIHNEIRLALKMFINISHEDYLFYYKMLFKIEEKCKLKIEIVNPYMKVKLINRLFAKKSSCSNTTYQNEIDSTNIKSDWSNSIILGNGLSNNSDSIPLECFKYIQMLAQGEQYRMCQNIPSSSQPQYNLDNVNVQDLNRYFSQNYTSVSFLEQQQHSKSTPLLQNIQPEMYINNSIIITNITSSSMNVDISLAELPRGITSQVVYKARLKKILKHYPNSFRIYTDASRIQDNVGIAIVSSTNAYSYKLSSDYTSNDAEAVAILRALDYALNNNYNDFVILSDSLTTIMCIQNLNTTSDIISSIFCIMHAHQLKGNIMHFIWIPSHNSIEGNEVADKLAKQIALSETAVTYSHNSFMATNIKYKCKQ